MFGGTNNFMTPCRPVGFGRKRTRARVRILDAHAIVKASIKPKRRHTVLLQNKKGVYIYTQCFII